MARRKTTKATYIEEPIGPTQVQLGQLITGAMNVHSDASLAELFEHSEGLDLSKENMKSIDRIVRSRTEKSISSALDQLLKYY